MFIMSLATADLIVGLIVIPLSATAFIFGPGAVHKYKENPWSQSWTN
jgi:hypothetical protein